MKKILIPAVFCSILLDITLSLGLAWNRMEIIVIVVSPSTISLESKGEWVTVHAEIHYADVAAATVELNGIPVNATFADNHGDLVAKFNFDDVKGSLVPGIITLTLSGSKKDGEFFYGTDTVKVINPQWKSFLPIVCL